MIDNGVIVTRDEVVIEEAEFNGMVLRFCKDGRLIIVFTSPAEVKIEIGVARIEIRP